MDDFDEERLLDAVVFEGTETAVLKSTGHATLTEHASSAMKALCQSLLPQHRRWWFARCKLEQNLPTTFEQIDLTLRRTVNKTMVTADLRVDGAKVGQLVFIGAKE